MSETVIKNGLIISGSTSTTGNVGIGTTSPTNPLHVHDAIINKIAIFSSGDNGGLIQINDNDTTSYVGSEGSLTYIGQTASANANNLIINSSGNVGIGTTSPAGGKLHVVSAGDELVRLEHSSGTGNPYISFIQSGTRRSYIQLLDSENNLRLASEYGIVSFLTGDANNETERMRITSAGNVGIGTTSPSYKLDVNGSLSATTLYGDGSNLTGISGVTINNNTNNYLVTATGTSGTLNGESNLIFDGNKMGVGISSPQAILDVSGSSTNGVSLQLRSGDGSSQNDSSQIIFSYNNSSYNNVGYAHSIRTRHNGGAAGNNAIDFWLWSPTDSSSTLGSKRVMSLDGTGNVGIGLITPLHRLQVKGSGTTSSTSVIYTQDSSNNFTFSVQDDGTVRAAGDIIAFYASDKNLKTNIEPLTNPIEKIKQVGGYEFDWKPESGKSGHDIGVLAQEIEQILPDIVTTRDNGYKAVRYEKIIPLLIEAIKDQQDQIDELKSKLK